VEKLAEPDRLQITNWCMHFACLITKATNTHSEYAIIIAFSWQQLLRKCSSMSCYTYNACLVGRYEYSTEHEIVQTSKFSLYDQVVTSYIKDESKVVPVHAMKEYSGSKGTAALDSKYHHKLRMSGQLHTLVASLAIQSIV
jgi:hypothetical protein